MSSNAVRFRTPGNFTPLYVAYLLNKQTIMKTASKTELLYKKDITLHLLLLNLEFGHPSFFSWFDMNQAKIYKVVGVVP